MAGSSLPASQNDLKNRRLVNYTAYLSMSLRIRTDEDCACREGEEWGTHIRYGLDAHTLSARATSTANRVGFFFADIRSNWSAG